MLDTLVTITLEVCRDTGRPLQLHTGFGDPDVDLLQANPLLLRPVLEDPRLAGVPIVALHMAYPYFREVAYLAAVWPQLYVDLSLALPFLGAGAILPLVEMLSLAPFNQAALRIGPARDCPELFALSADWGRASSGRRSRLAGRARRHERGRRACHRPQDPRGQRDRPLSALTSSGMRGTLRSGRRHGVLPPGAGDQSTGAMSPMSASSCSVSAIFV